MPKKLYQKPSDVFLNLEYLRNRELGYRKKLGFGDELCRKLTTSLETYHSQVHTAAGGIFNLEFSLNGSILAAACEKKSFLLYDALNRRLIKEVKEAHLNCVNCVRFLDNNTFATGSDDNTVKTWDVRYLKSSTRTLTGHSNWVKNIEYSTKENRLVTSAFDGGIYSWDLNNYTENSVVYERSFVMDGLMRTKLSPDGSKMIVCSTNGYLLMIHGLNLQTLNRDLRKFKPNLYRLMQISEQTIPVAMGFNKLFSPHRKTNRVELISDFPNDPEVISSLQIHPMNWCALSRNINTDELTEWTCVHDIQERTIEEYLNSYTLEEVSQSQQNEFPLLGAQNEGEINERNQERRMPMDLWMGYVTNQNIRAQRLVPQPSGRRIGTGIRTARTSVSVFNSGILSPEAVSMSNETENAEENEYGPIGNRYKIVQNLPRLTHFIEEPNVGKGFIKELCFSPDGRIICSPYHAGIRLFSFNISCNELSTCVPDRPQKLHTLVQFRDYHPEIVVSCKYNPCHDILVSGCLGGQIVWYQPKL